MADFWSNLANAGVALGGAILGGIGGSNTNNKSGTTTVTPWKKQQPYLIGGFSDAAGAYNALKRTPYYQGDLYAGITPLQRNAVPLIALR